MKKRYEVSWKMTGMMTVSAEDSIEAEEIVNNIDDPEEIIKHSIGIDFEATGSRHDIFDR